MARHQSENRPQRKAKLGQNFLVDVNAAGRIVDALGDIAGCTVVEIGPGRGAITQALAIKAQKLVAIELDRALAAQLRMAYGRNPRVEIIEASVLNVDFEALVQGRPRKPTTAPLDLPQKTARVVGNLPYYITSEILLKLFEFHNNFDKIVIMVQKEVADRISAEPGAREYGLLSATTRLFADAENLFTLPPGAFSPPPKVHSSVLRLRVNPKAGELGVEPRAFVGFLKTLFAQKRKTLFNNLRAEYGAERSREAIKASRLKESVRAEAITLEQMAVLFKSLI